MLPFKYSVTADEIQIILVMFVSKKWICVWVFVNEMLTILMRMTDLLLRTQFMHAVLFGQCNGQCKWRSINWTVEISESVQKLKEKRLDPLAAHWALSIKPIPASLSQYQRTFVYASILSSCHRNALAKRIPFRLLFEVPFLVASVAESVGHGD